MSTVIRLGDFLDGNVNVMDLVIGATQATDDEVAPEAELNFA